VLVVFIAKENMSYQIKEYTELIRAIPKYFWERTPCGKWNLCI